MDYQRADSGTVKNLQADISGLKSVVGELKEGQMGLLGQLHTIQGDTLRQIRTVAVLQLDIDRIIKPSRFSCRSQYGLLKESQFPCCSRNSLRRVI